MRISVADDERRTVRPATQIAILMLAVILASAGVLVAARFMLAGTTVPPTTLDARANAATVRSVFGSTRLVLLGPLPVVQGGGALAAGSEVRIALPELPSGSSAVLLDVTLSDATGPGNVIVESSAGQVTALRLARAKAQMTATVVARLGAVNVLTARTEGGGHLVVRLVGAFEPAESATAGRIVPVPATQVVRLVPKTDGKDATVDLSAVPALKDGGVSAVLLQFAADVGVNGGYVAAGPSADKLDQMILWNPTTADDRIRGGLLVVPVTGGSVHLHYQAGNVLTADLVGYVTGGASPESAAGLVVPVAPSAGAEVRIAAGQEADVTVAPEGVKGVPADRVTGALLGVTATGDALGAVTVHAPDAAAPANPTITAATGAVRETVTLVATVNGVVRVGAASGATVSLTPLAVILGG